MDYCDIFVSYRKSAERQLTLNGLVREHTTQLNKKIEKKHKIRSLLAQELVC